jgi:hypothetical protein
MFTRQHLWWIVAILIGITVLSVGVSLYSSEDSAVVHID